MLRRITTRLTSLFRRARLERELDRRAPRSTSTCSTEQHVRAGLSPTRRAARRSRLRRCRTGERRRAGHVAVAVVRDARAGRRYGLRICGAIPGSRSSSSRRWRSVSAPIPRFSASSTASSCGRCPIANGESWSSCGSSSRSRPRRHLFSVPGDRGLSDAGPQPGGIAEFHNMWFILLGCDEPERVSTGVVSANFFDVLGVSRLWPDIPAGGRNAGGAGRPHPRSRVLAAELSAGTRRRRPGLPDERPAASGDRDPAGGPSISPGGRRLYAYVGMSVPLRNRSSSKPSRRMMQAFGRRESRTSRSRRPERISTVVAAGLQAELSRCVHGDRRLPHGRYSAPGRAHA